jgi:2,4-dienoyl-CoA reductase-like NADH-dependent reductase (Old Yellow Enzyme family)
MGRENYQIFSEGQLAGLTTKNRLIRSATFEASMTKDGRVTESMLDLYRNLARGGVGMIITGHMCVSQNGRAGPSMTCIYDDTFIGEIAKVAEAVHDMGDGCKIVAQLSHAGRQVALKNHLAECVGPSAVPSPILKKQARELSTQEIRDLIACFVEAIVRVKKAGFDGVQLHAAHGWLLSSFLSPYTNRRNDRYGGSLRNRVSILREIIEKARQKVGNFPILTKINCDDQVEGGIDRDSFPGLAREIEGIGVDAIEVSGGMWDCLARTEAELGFFPLPIPEARTRINRPEKQSYFLEYVGGLDLAIPVILVGGNRNIERMEEICRQGKVSFFALSRPLISEPDLPRRWLEGRGKEDTDCVSCNSCLLIVANDKPLACMLKQNKIKQKVVKKVVPYVWKSLLK